MFSLMLKVLEKTSVGIARGQGPRENSQLAIALPFRLTFLLPKPRKSYSTLADQLPNRPNSRPMPAIQPQRLWLPLHEPLPLMAEQIGPPPPSMRSTIPCSCTQELALNWLVTPYSSLAQAAPPLM